VSEGSAHFTAVPPRGPSSTFLPAARRTFLRGGVLGFVGVVDLVGYTTSLSWRNPWAPKVGLFFFHVLAGALRIPSQAACGLLVTIRFTGGSLIRPQILLPACRARHSTTAPWPNEWLALATYNERPPANPHDGGSRDPQTPALGLPVPPPHGRGLDRHKQMKTLPGMVERLLTLESLRRARGNVIVAGAGIYLILCNGRKSQE